MKRHIGICIFAAALFFPLHAITLEEAMNAALQNDSTLADARSKLAIADNNLAKSLSLYGSSLSLSGNVSGSGESEGPAGSESAVTKSVGANLAVPLAKWLSVGISASSDLSESSGTLSLTLSPFAHADTAAKTAWNKASIEAQSAVRSTLLSVRKEYRAVLVAQAEVEYRTAAVQTAQNELSRIQYLVELGKERKSQEISAYSDLMDAQGELDTAEGNLSTAKQNLSLRTGIAEASLADFESLSVEEGRTLVDEESWVASSPEMAAAKVALEAASVSKKTGTTLPDLTLGTSVTDSRGWSVTAKVSLSPDLFFQKSKSTASENLSIQERSFANTERSVRTAWANQQSALVKAERNYGNATRFLESAQLSYTETELLLEKGEASRATLDSANENLLSAKYQLLRALESLDNSRDQLDVSWQVAVK